MKMNEDDRKKLEKFWRRKLWLGLAAVGAIGLAAWRVSVVQGRYDEVLIQESRELPEKVYQELIAEVRKGVPILPQHPPGSDLPKYPEIALRCNSILALGFLRDSRAIPELGNLLSNDVNRAVSCRHHSVYYQMAQENSVYASAAFALKGFKEAEAISYLKTARSKVPSPRLLSIWRHFFRQEFFMLYENRIMVSNEKIIQYDAQPIPEFINSPDLEVKNLAFIQSLLNPPLAQANLEKIRARVQENSNPGMKQQESDIEELFREYVKQILITQAKSFEAKSETAEGTRKNISEKYPGEFKYDKRRFIATLSSKQDPTGIPMDATGELVKSSQVKAEILALFANDKSSPEVLDRVRSNLAKLHQSSPLWYQPISDILFEILLIDIQKNRSINPEYFYNLQVSDATKARNVTHLISKPNSKNKLGVAIVLQAIDDPRAVLELVQIVQGSNVIDRNFAAKLLGEIGDPSAAPALLKVLQNLRRPSGLSIQDQSLRIHSPSDILGAPLGYITVSGFIGHEAISKNIDERSYYIFVQALIKIGNTPFLSSIWNQEEKKKIISELKQLLTLSSTQGGNWTAAQIRCSAASILLDFGNTEGVSSCIEQILALEKKQFWIPQLSPFSRSNTEGHHIFEDYNPSPIESSFFLSVGLSEINPAIQNSILIHLSRHPEIKVRRAAIAKLASDGELTGRKNTKLMIDSLKDSDSIVRSFAFYGILSSPSILTPPNRDYQLIQKYVISGLTDSEPRIRKYSLLSLIYFQPPEIQNLLLKLLKDPEPSIRSQASHELLRYKNDSSLDELITTTKDKSQVVRAKALISLNNINVGEPRLSNEYSNNLIITANLEALQDSDNGVKKVALDYLSSISINDRRIAPAIVSALRAKPNIADERQLLKESVLPTLESLFDRGLVDDASKQAALPMLVTIYKHWNNPDETPQRARVVRLIRKFNESEKFDRTAQQRAQQFFYLETGILGAIGLTSLILLLTNLRLRNPYPFTWSGYLLFPEEVIAELIALAQRRKVEKRSKWQIRLEITYEVLLLLWAFHISIRIENMKLPPGGNRSAK